MTDKPQELRAIELRIEAGEDPDLIPGVEKLWLWYLEQNREAFDAYHTEFFEWCKQNPEQAKPQG